MFFLVILTLLIFIAGFFQKVRQLSWLSAPLTRTLVSFVVVALGIISSFYLMELKQAIFFLWNWELNKIDPIATNFGLFFFISLAFFYLSQSAVQEQEAVRNKELQDLINSAPPSDFLQRYSERCSEAFETYRILQDDLPTASKSDVEIGIRVILQNILTITRLYSRETTPAIIYAANIMLGEAPSTSQNIVFRSPALDIGKLKAVLTTYKEISVTTKNGTNADPELALISLPIFQEADNRIIPGAPEAFESAAIFPVPDTLDGTWLKNIEKFDEVVREQIKKYFNEGDGKKIRSFISIPLLDAAKPYAVLNIHSNKTSPWCDAQTAEKIMYLITPCLDQLNNLLKHWKKM